MSNLAISPEFAELLDDAEPVVVRPAAREVMLQGGAYEGAGRFDQSMALWQPPILHPDQEIIDAKPLADARTRDMLRNDAYVAGGSTLHKDNIVGSLFLLNAKPMSSVLFPGGLDEVWEQEFQEEVETKFTLWAESPNCWSDAARTNTLTAMVRLSVGVHTAGGEVLAVANWMPDDGRPYRTALQMVDADRLSTPMDAGYNTRIKGGVEKDRYGAPIAYHIRNGHPSDWSNVDSYTWRRVMARKPGWGRQMVLHIFEQLRPDQSRGISAMVTALMEMKMTRGFRKVELQRAVVASTYAASIESDIPAEAYAAMGVKDDGDNPSLDYMADFLDAINEYSKNSQNLMFDGAKIPVFMPNTHLKLQNPGNSGPMGDKFEASLLRHIAAALGVSYEQLSRDYTQTNYSSARAAMGETWKHMLTRKKFVADATGSFVYRLWLEEAINYNNLECLKRRNIPNFYEGMNADAYSNCEWIGAGQGMIDPLKETQAQVLALKHGLTTLEVEIARRAGSDWRAVMRQIKREKTMAETLDIPSVYTMETTEQDNALSGSPQERES